MPRNALFRRTSRLAFVVGLVIAAVLSLIPGAVPVHGHDKTAHLAAYGLLAIAGSIGFPGSTMRWVLFFGLSVYGGLLEVGQMFVPNRFSSGLDAAANTAGALIGISLVALSARFGWLPEPSPTGPGTEPRVDAPDDR